MKLSYLQQLNVENLAYDTMNLAKYHDGMKVCMTEQFVAVNSRLPSYNFNIITPTTVLDSMAKERLHAEIDAFNEQQLPFNIWCYAHDTELIHFLKRIGLTEYETAYEAMTLQLEKFQESNLASLSLRVKRITSPEQLKNFVAVLHTIYEEKTEREAIKSYYTQLSDVLLTESDVTQLFIGTFRGEVVTTGALTFKGESVGMYHIATHPKFRGHGFATEMVQYLLCMAKNLGAKYCTLQSSPAAKRIYESFGFETIGHLKVYENKEPSPV